jgi:quercetin dioxygenase-like cupin family protein
MFRGGRRAAIGNTSSVELVQRSMFGCAKPAVAYTCLSFAFFLGCAGHPVKPPNGAVTPPASISRALVGHHDLLNLPGWESRLYRIEYGPGVAAPLHHHPVEGIGYVVSGRFESAFEGEPPVTIHAGESFTDRPLVAHVLFRNPDPEQPLTFLIAYVVRKGDPVVEMP